MDAPTYHFADQPRTIVRCRVNVAGDKIGGDVTDATVLFPDPMGATGGSIVHAASMYRKLEGGQTAKMIALHLIVTPEYLKRVLEDFPRMIVYAVRLDDETGIIEARV